MGESCHRTSRRGAANALADQGCQSGRCSPLLPTMVTQLEWLSELVQHSEALLVLEAQAVLPRGHPSMAAAAAAQRLSSDSASTGRCGLPGTVADPRRRQLWQKVAPAEAAIATRSAGRSR